MTAEGTSALSQIDEGGGKESAGAARWWAETTARSVERRCDREQEEGGEGICPLAPIAASIGGFKGGAGVAAAPSWTQKSFNRFSFFAKDFIYLVFFLCLFYESLSLKTLNQY